VNTVRLPFHLKEPRFAQNSNIYNRRNGTRKIVSASVSSEYDLETDYLTEEMHRKLIIALMHDEVYINGQLLTKTGDYSIDWENYLMENGRKTAKGRCAVSANSVSRTSNCGGYAYSDFYVWPMELLFEAS